MKKVKFLTVFILIAVLGLTACNFSGSGDIDKSDNSLKIIASIFPAYDFTRAVTGEANTEIKANIELLIKPGNSVHSYDPSFADVKTIKNCDVFICMGGQDEAWIERLDLSEETKIIRLIEAPDLIISRVNGLNKVSDLDEHLWTSPYNAVKCVEFIASQLAEIDEENADFYKENAENYIKEIKAVDDELKEIFASSKRDKIIMADRFAFLNFTDYYSLKYEAAFDACSDQSDASFAAVARLIKVVSEENIPYVFYAELSSKSVAEAISEETGAELLLLHSCQNVTADEFERGETYVSLMEKNAENLKLGLS